MRLHAAGTNLLTGTSRAPVREFGATSAPGGGTWLDRLGAGVGGFVSSSPYEGVGYEVRAIPVVTYIGERLVVTGPGATWLLGRTFDPATVSLGLNWEFPGPRITDSPIVRNGPYFAAFGSVTWRF
jgi:outer membrane scaffolding protein for murein synthesis (MipA/OmpV family)